MGCEWNDTVGESGWKNISRFVMTGFLIFFAQHYSEWSACDFYCQIISWKYYKIILNKKLYETCEKILTYPTYTLCVWQILYIYI